MLQTGSQKIIASLAIMLALVGLGYYVFTSTEIPVADISLSEQEVLGQEIIILASKVENISFDQSVFASTIFSSLVDYHLPLNPESQGRSNPFGLIGTDGGSINSTARGNSR